MCRRAVARSENPGGHVVLGGDNVPPLVEIGHGLLDRWTSQYDWGITAGGLNFILNNGTKTHLIIVKLLENTCLGMKKVRAWPILTLARP